ncbi:hypothetical protein GcM3_023030 [Golovinomyces cichoracearum]|uniref:Uncharacterized protein n=1 Tax=Golovinomyces cichoracearum TaxID=62708 RepID=A0A420J710_9PEZI|nr:hypothetical protein GcM3_023030 [Golovinomyces cichoracearum]
MDINDEYNPASPDTVDPGTYDPESLDMIIDDSSHNQSMTNQPETANKSQTEQHEFQPTSQTNTTKQQDLEFSSDPIIGPTHLLKSSYAK